MMEHNVFVPNGSSRHVTAVILTEAATEHGIDQHSIKATSRGFFITEELADVVYDGAVEDESPETPDESPETPDEAPAKPDRTTSTSGNRAAKTAASQKKE